MTSVRLLLLAFLLPIQTANAPVVTSADFGRLAGHSWKGVLTYRDYSSGKSTSIRSNLRVEGLASDSTAWLFHYRYPDEPKADGTDTVLVGMAGRMLDGASVIERTKGKDGSTSFVTRKTGRDNNRPATIRTTFRIGGRSFSIRKQVQYEDETEWMERNRYEWKR
jgi:hypothetical protein